MFRVLFLIVAFIGTAASVQAQEFYLKSMNGADTVWVWKDKASHDEAMQLINAGVHKTNPGMILTLLACVVEPGAQVIISDMGFVTHDIVVVSGSKAGCRGNIPAEELGSR